MLTVLGDAPKLGKRLRVRVRCECGREYEIYRFAVGKTQSCGCVKSKKLVERLTTHGQSGRSEYSIWAAMKARCSNPSARHFGRYGGRGICVCGEWAGSFEAFFRDVGPRPSPCHSLDRIDNDGNYEPGNVRWAIQAEQNRNRSNNKRLVYKGVEYCMVDLAKMAGINKNTFNKRLRSGWSVEMAVETPVRS